MASGVAGWRGLDGWTPASTGLSSGQLGRLGPGSSPLCCGDGRLGSWSAGKAARLAACSCVSCNSAHCLVEHLTYPVLVPRVLHCLPQAVQLVTPPAFTSCSSYTQQHQTLVLSGRPLLTCTHCAL